MFVFMSRRAYCFNLAFLRQAKSITRNSLLLVDTLGTTLLSFKTAGEKKAIFKSHAMAMTLERKQPSKIGSENLSANEDEGAVTFPSPDLLFGKNGTDLPSVDTQVR